MLLKTIQVGQIGTNCYILSDEVTLDTAVIDPGDEAERILEYVESEGLKVKYILLTHGHFDHTLGVGRIQERTGAPVYVHRADSARKREMYKYDAAAAAGEVRFFGEGDALRLGDEPISEMHTPGHSEGSCTLRCEDMLFTGDTLFRDTCGRTDLPGGDFHEIIGSLRKLYELEGDFEVLPGHEAPTTLARERRLNMYMRQASDGDISGK